LQIASVCSTESDPSLAVKQVCDQVRHSLGGPASLAFWFFSGHFGGLSGHSEALNLANQIRDELGTGQLAGCNAQGLVANGLELESPPGMVLWALRSEEVEVELFHLNFVKSADGGAFTGWPDSMVSDTSDAATIVMLADPYSFPTDSFLARLNEDRPGTLVYGGMCSGMHRPGQAILVAGSAVHNQGMIGVSIRGNVVTPGMVSQGCRPIGKPLVITRGERNEIHELGGRPALEQIQSMFATLPVREKLIINQRGGLHIGRVVSEYRETFGSGDFLVRNIIGIDEESGALVVSDFFRTGQTVQFHIRDAETADADLKLGLLDVKAAATGCSGALLFTCNGRGRHLFESDHHDSGMIRQVIGDVALAGFFAAGEAGPVAGQNFVHGFTASVLFFGKRQ
jgi:small ligand-binding sensory domain FIST